MADPSTEAPSWLAAQFLERGEPRPALLRGGRAQVWASSALIAKIHPDAMAESSALEQSVTALAGTVVPVAQPRGVSEGPSSQVTWWQRVPIARPATGPETLAWLRALHDLAPVPTRKASLILRSNRSHELDKEFLNSLAPVIAEQYRAAQALSGLPRVFIHADANPTNIVVDSGGDVTGLDFEFSGAGPRVFDIATVGVLQEETGAGTLEEALTAYGQHAEVTVERVTQAASVVRANRIVVCALHPGWLAEGWDRLRAWHEGRAYVFPAGAGPK